MVAGKLADSCQRKPAPYIHIIRLPLAGQSAPGFPASETRRSQERNTSRHCFILPARIVCSLSIQRFTLNDSVVMHFLERTLPTPLENLALDEALLAACEAGEIIGGVLRLWESPDYFVVLGRSSDPEIEVKLAVCREQNIPVLRRVSGGGTVLSGPGCLSYAVVLDYEEFPHLRAVDLAHQYVLSRVVECLAPLVPDIAMAGTSDLVLTDTVGRQMKCSGNALRCKRTHFLYHGTLLYDLDLARLRYLLATPTRVPDYRQDRTHEEFVTNLPLSRQQLCAALKTGWQATAELGDWPSQRTAAITGDKQALHSRWIVL